MIVTWKYIIEFAWLQVFEQKSNGRSRTAKIWYGHMCLMEIDLVLIMVENRLNYYV
jgi:hypothetical protein